MRRIPLLLSVVAVVLLGMFAVGRLTGITGAQEASPAAEEAFPPEGVSFELLGYSVVDTLPSAPAALVLFRLTLEPGASFPIDPADASLALVYVESGTLTINVDVPLSILRAATIRGLSDAAPEVIAAGVEVTVGPGDSFVGPPNTGGEVRNDGTDPVVILVSEIDPGEGAPPTAATPAA